MDNISESDLVAVVTSEFITGQTADGQKWIICRTCNAKSFLSWDVEQRYCGNCHDWHEDCTGYARRNK